MRRALSLAACLLALAGCASDDPISALDEFPEEQIILANATQPDDWQQDPYSILEARVEGDVLRLKISYGGCAEHETRLVAYSYFMESIPVQAGLLLAHDVLDETCLALRVVDLRFDLSPLKQDFLQSYAGSPGVIMLRLRQPGGDDVRVLYRF